MSVIGSGIDVPKDTKPFEQVRELIVNGIATGQFTQAARIPTVRALSAELGMATNTVARAYRDLEHAGVIVTMGRCGSFVAPRNHRAAHAANQFLASLTGTGFSPTEAIALVQA